MQEVPVILLEQARKARERAWFYRRLAHALGGSQSVLALEKCANELEERAATLEHSPAKENCRASLP